MNNTERTAIIKAMDSLAHADNLIKAHKGSHKDIERGAVKIIKAWSSLEEITRDY